MGVKFNIGFVPSADAISAARAASGMVTKNMLRIRQFQLIGICNALVGSFLKCQPGNAEGRANQMRAVANALKNPADTNRRDAASSAASALDAASAAFAKDSTEDAVTGAVTGLEAAFVKLVTAFQITNDSGAPLTIDDMPEPEQRDQRDDNGDRDAEPFNVVKRGKRRAE